MPYTILKSKKQKYLKMTVHIAFLILEKYRGPLLRYCKEKPYLPLTAEEIFSDLLIDRMPRFVQNFKRGTRERLKEMLETDLTAGREYREFNKSQLNRQILEQVGKSKEQKHCADIVKELEKKTLYLQHLEKLADLEKSLLAYLRSCVRRTKIKYLQTYVGSKQNRTTFNADPTNGLANVEQFEHTNSEVELQKALTLLKTADLPPVDLEIIMDAIVYQLSFKELGEKLGCSRSTAARRYQEAMRLLLRKLRGTGELNIK